MDTSETYVKMCQKAKEIQPEYLNYGDYYIWVSGNWYIWSDDNQSKRTEERTWLPRQDQLLELSGLTWKEFDSLCLSEDAPTKEQAGLRVLMKKYSKIFNGENWINEKGR